MQSKWNEPHEFYKEGCLHASVRQEARSSWVLIWNRMLIHRLTIQLRKVIKCKRDGKCSDLAKQQVLLWDHLLLVWKLSLLIVFFLNLGTELTLGLCSRHQNLYRYFLYLSFLLSQWLHHFIILTACCLLTKRNPFKYQEYFLLLTRQKFMAPLKHLSNQSFQSWMSYSYRFK